MPFQAWDHCWPIREGPRCCWRCWKVAHYRQGGWGGLARVAAVSAQSASAHLAKLSKGGLITAQREGRCRYYKLAGPRVANALEALGAISTVRPVADYATART